MKLIEAMKEVKRLEEKMGDLINKIGKYCADWDFENATYPDQKAQVGSWLQGVHDTAKECADLKMRIQKTNIATLVPIEMDGRKIEHSIAEWIMRRRIYASFEEKAWKQLSDKGMSPTGAFKSPTGDQKEFKMRLYYDPVERDKKIELYRSEPGIIDRTMEVMNATTELL